MHRDLVGYARALGLPCFPCNADKSPMVKRGFLAATTDIDGGLFSRASLIGVPTGQVTGFDVLDVDLAAKEWWGENKWRIPPTRTHRTRSGGLHLFFRHHEGLRNTCSRIAPGVDTRANGGSVIWWPAIGLPIICHVPPTSWPAWLLEAQRLPMREPQPFQPTTDRYARAALRSAADIVAKAGDGTRNHTLNAQTFALARFVPLLSVEEITETMLRAASVCGLSHLEAERTITSALKGR